MRLWFTVATTDEKSFIFPRITPSNNMGKARFKYLTTREDKYMEQIVSRLDQLKALEQHLVARMLDEYGFDGGNSLSQIKEEFE